MATSCSEMRSELVWRRTLPARSISDSAERIGTPLPFGPVPVPGAAANVRIVVPNSGSPVTSRVICVKLGRYQITLPDKSVASGYALNVGLARGPYQYALNTTSLVV